ncbi:dienelactone hydrolase family protein [Anaerobacillus sp. CMMVII]|uniref:alpha/beta hydrolase family protein n=1 Tax=Anaerobacillus sp. CMMVII TaxID=2755588 RepID=UPI0021B79DB6|nr:alpha/beta fold hydrolase [Anaerobacillus sp. CMMVII]MCT8139603.1 dienelactone hydrolase family protein [Anaerobacillus sp. CMMVII]
MNKQELRNRLYSLLGELPARETQIQISVIAVEENEHYKLEKLLLDLNGLELVPAYFLKPLHSDNKKLPTILFNHSHGGKFHLGKEELTSGNSYLYTPAFGIELTKMGYAVLCIDAWGFGERSTRTESSLFKEMLWKGQVLWGMRVFDSIRALDYLQTRSDVDGERIGTMGMSMGGIMTWWLAALDTRIKWCVDVCGLADFQALIETDSLDKHGFYFYVPRLLKYFSTAEINSLIAPRPHLSVAGIHDKLIPVSGLERIEPILKQIYENEGKPQNWSLKMFDCGHEENKEMREEIVRFLKRNF